MAKLKFQIDTENREHVPGHDGGSSRELSEAEYRKIEAAADDKDK